VRAVAERLAYPVRWRPSMRLAGASTTARGARALLQKFRDVLSAAQIPKLAAGQGATLHYGVVAETSKSAGSRDILVPEVHRFPTRLICSLAPPRRSGGSAIRLGLLLFAALLFFDACHSFAKDSLFTDLPVYSPATNGVRATMATNTVTASTNAASSLSAGTNSVAGTATNAMTALDNQYHLAIGDRISFQIKEDEGDPQLLTVMDSGDLEVPYIGRYPAEGKTCKQLAYELKAILEKEYYYRATVIISVDLKAKSRGKVYLVGAVRMPGPQDIPNDESFTLSKAVMRAGGFTEFADGRHVRVTRSIPGKGDKTYTLDVQEVLQDGKIDSDLKLEPGDLIYVPEKLVHF
jgi:protein involved in polysaccharide export with SLBB domain